jgi:hypothetical protein
LGTSRRTAHRIISSATRSDQERRTFDEAVNARHDVFPFFVGFARSGTTLLRAMVDSHPEIGIPPESHFVTELAPCRARYEASGRFDVEHFAADLCAHAWFRWWRIAPDELLAALRDAAPAAYSDAIRTVFSRWATRHGKPRYGDKTPTYLTELALVAALFPEARFVHLVRDGRDAALAYADAFDVPVEKAIGLWRSRVEDARGTGAALGCHRYCEIKYEDLVADSESTLRAVCRFIDLPFSERMVRHWEHAEDMLTGAPDREIQRHVEWPPTVGLRDWRSQMPQHVARACELVAGNLLEDLGYEAGPTRFSLRSQVLVGRSQLERGARFVRAAVAQHTGARPSRPAAANVPRVPRAPTRSGPPWPDPLQLSLLRVAFLERDEAVEEWRMLRDRLVLDDVWDAETHRLLPLVYRRLVQLGVEDPELPRLKGLHRHAWYQNQLNLSRLAPFLTRLEGAGIRTMVIKGVPLALRFHGDLGSRPMNDVDVLVPTDRMADALRLLEQDGWRSHSDGRHPVQKLTAGFSLISHHSRIVTAPDGFYVDLHWHLREQFVVPGEEMTSSDDFWAAASSRSGMRVRGGRPMPWSSSDIQRPLIGTGSSIRPSGGASFSSCAPRSTTSSRTSVPRCHSTFSHSWTVFVRPGTTSAPSNGHCRSTTTAHASKGSSTWDRRGLGVARTSGPLAPCSTSPSSCGTLGSCRTPGTSRSKLRVTSSGVFAATSHAPPSPRSRLRRHKVRRNLRTEADA